MKARTRRRITAAWLVAILIPAALEAYTLLNAEEGDTLSEHVIPALHELPDAVQWALLAAYVAAAVWLAWHWWFQYRRRP